MTGVPIDHPDFVPAANRVAAWEGPSGSLPATAGNASEVSYGGDAVGDFVLVSFILQPGAAGGVYAPTLLDDEPQYRRVFALGTDNLQPLIPYPHRGAGVDLQHVNTTGGDLVTNYAVLTFAGITADLILPAQVDFSAFVQVPTPSDTSDPIDVPQATLYERCALFAQGDDAFDLTVQRGYVFHSAGGWFGITADEQVASSADGSVVTADVVIGAPGFAVRVTNQGVGALHSSVQARAYRPAGV